MNFEKFLKNPVTVALLCISALVMIYSNVIRPLTSDNSSDSMPDSEYESDLSVPVADESENVELLALSPDSTLMKRTAIWTNDLAKDPFRTLDFNHFHIPDSVYNNAVVMYDSSLLEFSLTFPKTRAVPVIGSDLKAISIGPSGKKIVLGSRIYKEGDSCRHGLIRKIDTNSVLITNNSGITTLKLAGKHKEE